MQIVLKQVIVDAEKVARATQRAARNQQQTRPQEPSGRPATPVAPSVGPHSRPTSPQRPAFPGTFLFGHFKKHAR